MEVRHPLERMLLGTMAVQGVQVELIQFQVRQSLTEAVVEGASFSQGQLRVQEVPEAVEPGPLVGLALLELQILEAAAAALALSEPGARVALASLSFNAQRSFVHTQR